MYLENLQSSLPLSSRPSRPSKAKPKFGWEQSRKIHFYSGLHLCRVLLQILRAMFDVDLSMDFVSSFYGGHWLSG